MLGTPDRASPGNANLLIGSLHPFVSSANDQLWGDITHGILKASWAIRQTAPEMGCMAIVILLRNRRGQFLVCAIGAICGL